MVIQQSGVGSDAAGSVGHQQYYQDTATGIFVKAGSD